MSSKFKTYYQLVKPGIIYGNAFTSAAGFFIGARAHSGGLHFNLGLFVAMLLGLSFVIGSACVLNNLIDRDIDISMQRTKNRALVTGEISAKSAVIYALILGAIGIFVLARYTNYLALWITLVGALIYVAFYAYAKRHSVYGTHVGSIAGAVPPVVGYCAASGKFDAGAVILFLILVLWQMPHFFSIAIYRLQDYAAASIPVLPAKKGIRHTKIQILIYIIAFFVAALALKFYSYAGWIYLIAAVLVCAYWLFLSLRGFKKGNDDSAWARKMFFVSLIVITVLCVAMAADTIFYQRLPI